MAKLIITDSYFNLFEILTKELQGRTNSLDGRNLVFCEEKVSLMAERHICAQLKGSFNTDVYSFGNYLRVKKPMDRLLSKEGSAMAVKRILKDLPLKCFRSGKQNLAPALFELIIQLKSAKVTPKDLAVASEKTSGILKNKLTDICAVYSAYEEFIKENGFEDQSSSLTYLPNILENSEEVKRADVYVLGFSGWTKQIRSAIKSLLKTAKSVTAILVDGENKMVYVGETVRSFKELCHETGVPLTEQKVSGGLCAEGTVISQTLFNPIANKLVKKPNEKLHYGVFSTVTEEIKRVGEEIKTMVMSGKYRYKDITVALPDALTYREKISETFGMLGIQYFLDERKNVLSHPLITLISSYSEVFRKGFERGALLSFLKNPLFGVDKTLSDNFENYIIKYNVNYGRIKEPFTFESIDGVELSKLEELRVKLIDTFKQFDVKRMLLNLNVSEKLKDLSSTLLDAGETIESVINEQIYDSVMKILAEMQMLLGGTDLSVTEYVNVFLSGVQALELSIIPQYNDAVFVGGYKETALGKAKLLFAVGLNNDVPNTKADVALLSDGDIDALEDVKLLVEPKIRVVNHRTRENVGMALSAFEDKLYLSYSSATVDGKKKEKSEVLTALEKRFNFLPYPNGNGYLTKLQGAYTFAREIGEFAEGKTDDIPLACSYYKAVDDSALNALLENANKEIKERLDGNRSALIGSETAPTVIEDYFKCPYRAFVSHVLKLRAREEGEVKAFSVGNFMHDILKEFVDGIANVGDDSDCYNLFEEIKNKIANQPEYKRFYSDKATASTINRVIEECGRYCLKTYSNIKSSAFTESRTEQAFGKGKSFPPVLLNGGKFKLCGKIDRVDLGDDYFRVIDYKTGATDVSNESLFSGNKLQLYLYAQAVKQKYADGSKKLAGLYYLPISDKYEKQSSKEQFIASGKSLDQEDVASMHGENFVPMNKSGKIKNGTSQEVLEKYVDYAVAVCEKAVSRMQEGVIIRSPYQGVCEYCEYSAFCAFEGDARSVGTVTEQTITDANKGGKEDATND